jgi:hypothetical protein
VPAVKLRNEAIKEAQSVFFIIVLRGAAIHCGIKVERETDTPGTDAWRKGKTAWTLGSGNSIALASAKRAFREGSWRTAITRGTEGLQVRWTANGENMAAPFVFIILTSYVVV